MPGSYGAPPPGFRLPENVSLGRVTLQVADLERSLDFYRNTLGLLVINDSSAAVVLGAADGTELVSLHEQRGARAAPQRGRLGLYHFAILLPDRPALGRFAQHLGQINARAGASDHLVSEAFYLQDPDNLGIEIYADRPRSQWQRAGNQLLMASDPIDIAGLVADAGPTPWSGMPAGTTMGHLHLHVGDIEQASAFYSDTIGFDRMSWQYPGALFLAGGGYHHHLGVNTWAGRGAVAPEPDDAQLLEWTIDVATEGIARSLEAAGHAHEEDVGDGIVVRDPWGTTLRVREKPG